jgi:hypothetical protein
MLPLPTTGEKGGWVGGSKILDRIYIHTYKITCFSIKIELNKNRGHITFVCILKLTGITFPRESAFLQLRGLPVT